MHKNHQNGVHLPVSVCAEAASYEHSFRLTERLRENMLRQEDDDDDGVFFRCLLCNYKIICNIQPNGFGTHSVPTRYADTLTPTVILNARKQAANDYRQNS